jgi:hypothetical protein
MGELRQRGKVWWIRYYRDGRRYEESSGSTKYERAGSLLRRREGDIDRGLPITPKIGRLRFDEAAEDLRTDYKINKRKATDHGKRRIDLALSPYFGGRRMTTITTSDIRTYIAQRQDNGAANATINRELAALKRMYTLAIQAGKPAASAAYPDARGAKRPTGILRARGVRKCPGTPAGRSQAIGDVRVHHRLANEERDPTAALVAGRSLGRRRAPRTEHEQKPRRPRIHVFGNR